MKQRRSQQPTKPLVYSCSGCSNVAQLANSIAVSLDRNGLAEMSCISGVGGDVKPLVNKALSGRNIIAIDGCPLACVKSCLKRHHISANKHYELTQLKLRSSSPSQLKKNYSSDCSEEEFESVYQHICNDIS